MNLNEPVTVEFITKTVIVLIIISLIGIGLVLYKAKKIDSKSK